MKKSILILTGIFVGLLCSCSSDEEVKSSRNFIEEFEVAGIKGEIRNDQDLIYLLVFAEDYEKFMKSDVEPQIRTSANSTWSTYGGHWTEDGFLYTIIAENGQIKKYSIRIDVMRKEYGFESWDLSGRTSGYYVLSDSNSSWTSGNEGISWAFQVISKDSQNPENYPTRKTTEGYIGNAVLMETVEGAVTLEKPLFSGNLIFGNFNMKVAMSNELAAIEVGRKYPAKPKKITGYYKYKEGPGTFINNNGVPPRNNDSCSMIVTFYRSDLPGGGDTTLTVENRDISSLVIAKTRKQDCKATEGDGFHPFELELVYNDEPNFENHRYKLGMTFAASKDGDYFSGKIGSKLIVDEIEIIDF